MKKILQYTTTTLKPADYITEEERLYLELQDNVVEIKESKQYQYPDVFVTEYYSVVHVQLPRMVICNYNKKDIVIYNQIVRKRSQCINHITELYSLILVDIGKKLVFSTDRNDDYILDQIRAIINEYTSSR